MTSQTVGGFDLSVYLDNLKEKQEKSKPAQVFLNHFSAICFHIENGDLEGSLLVLKHFQEMKEGACKCDHETIRKALYNCWSTEYALRLTANQDNDDFLGVAIQWALPQAYYSVYQSLNAFIRTSGAITSTHTSAIKKFAELMKSGKYPDCLSFYCDGDYKQLNFSNLPLKGSKSSLARIKSNEDAQTQIGMLLKGTREELAEQLKTERQKSAKPILTKDGKVLRAFSNKQWAEIIKPNQVTTLYDFLYRLRLKANYKDIESLICAEINFVEFHDCIHKIVGYINLVHEAYIAKSIGASAYNELVTNFPKHPRHQPVVLDRWHQQIIGLITY